MDKSKVQINGEEYEVIPVILSSTVPDDEFNTRCLFEALAKRAKDQNAIRIDREVSGIGEINSYTVLLLKKV